MRALDMIEKKREGHSLSAVELQQLIAGYVAGQVPDYQMAAWAMAVYFQGMSSQEIADLTEVMAASGEQYDLSAIRAIVVDKHSTGGVGDKTTLVVAPLAAAAGVVVAKMSGRGLGHTGGTLDKLEALKGFRFELSFAEMLAQLEKLGIAVVGQSGNLVPADKLLYALRDVTGTVPSLPLIASSIMSKKIASGAQALVLDVKFGSGAFMQDYDDAKALAVKMVRLGEQLGRRTVAWLTSMEQPLGLAVGNALEVEEAMEVLRGAGPQDVRELSIALAAEMVLVAGIAESIEAATESVTALLDNGGAWEKFKHWITAQGGDGMQLEDVAGLPQAVVQEPYVAVVSGVVQAIDAAAIGRAAMQLGAGRARKEDAIDPLAGILLAVKIGDRIERGQPLAWLHTSEADLLLGAIAVMNSAYTIKPTAVELKPILVERISLQLSD